MQSLYLFVIFVFLSLFIVPLFLKKKTFSLSNQEVPEQKISFFIPLIALFLYVGLATSVLTALVLFFPHSSFAQTTLFQLIALFTALTVLIGFSKLQKEEIKQCIWGSKKFFKPLCKGILFSIALYPVVMSFVEIIHLVVSFFAPFDRVDQTAILHLKNLRSTPAVFWLFLISAFTMVPVLEELLFRGFIQTYLVRLFGLRAGIIVASLIFSLFHYSVTQGMTNVEMLCGLFFLSYLIGCAYMKEKSLFVAIGMHAAFNAISCALMFVVD